MNRRIPVSFTRITATSYAWSSDGSEQNVTVRIRSDQGRSATFGDGVPQAIAPPFSPGSGAVSLREIAKETR